MITIFCDFWQCSFSRQRKIIYGIFGKWKCFQAFYPKNRTKRVAKRFIGKFLRYWKLGHFLHMTKKKFLTIFDFLTSFACKPNLKMDVEDELQHSHWMRTWSRFFWDHLGRNLQIKPNLVKIKFVIMTLYGFKILSNPRILFIIPILNL
jgi:hypothetical protein